MWKDCGVMKDSFGREINYLRISLTDRCNLRCSYCMPEKGIANKTEHKEILPLEDVYRIARIFAKLGVNKIRLTGGEPLVRRGIVDLVRMLSDLEGVTDLAMTTNGLLLKDMARPLKEAGLGRINVSLDTLDKDKYKEITRGGDLAKVLDGINEAKAIGLTPIKINTVLIGGFNDNEIIDFINITQNKNIDVRFIELMPIGEAAAWAKENFVSNNKVLESAKDLEEVKKDDLSSPANYYRLPDAKGKVGIINPISCKFCEHCNRVRLTATGKLKLCLHSNREIDLKQYLHSDEALESIIKEAIMQKEEEHKLENGDYITRNMNQIGG